MADFSAQRASRQSSVRSINWFGLTLLLLSLLAAVPLWNGPGLLNTRGGGDSPFLFFRLHQLTANLHEGVFPVRWMPDAAYGLGYPFFNYYAALPYYFAAIFNLIGFDLLVSIKIVQTLGFVFAAFAMYRWADRHFTSRWAAWLAAVAYLYAPFHLVNVYVRGDSLSEFYAFVFYPLILLAIDLVLESPRAFPWLALSFAGLVLTHNISALIFSPFAILYVLVQLQGSKNQNLKSKIGALALGFLLGLALSAFYWLPALGEAPLAQLDVQTTGYFNYSQHFRAADLIQNSPGFDYSITTIPGSTTPFAMGLTQSIATAAGLIALISTWRRDSHTRFRVFVLVGLALSTFMITPLSRPLWDHLPLLPLAQFPWRFLSVQTLFTSLAVGYVALLLIPRLRLLVPLVGLLLAASTLLTLHPDYLPIRAEEIEPARLQLYEAFTSNIGTTIRAEYLPRTMIPRPYTGPSLIDPAVPPRPIVSEGTATATQTQRASTHQAWQVTVNSDTAQVSFPLLYWPGWRAFVDGQAVEASAAPDLGTIQIDVPRGDHHVEFQLGNTSLETAGDIISLVAVLIVLACLFLNRGASERGRQPLRQALRTPTALIAFGLIALAIGWALLTQQRYAVENLPGSMTDETMDFVDKPWLHHNPDGADFGGTARLMDYTIDAPGPDTVNASFHWKLTTPDAVTATLALVSPSSHLFGGPDMITQVTVPIHNDFDQQRLRAPYPLSTGMYYVKVQIGNNEKFLRPIWIENRGEGTSSHEFGKLTPAISLDAVQVQHLDPNHLDVLLKWGVTDITDANYGISLRLRDDSGKQWAVLDTQTGYGFQPTGAWQPGQINDDYTLELPDNLPRDRTYALDVILYRIASQQELGRTTIDHIQLDQPYAWRPVEPPTPSFVEPPLQNPVDALFGDQIQLLGYNLMHADDTLQIDLIWKARRNIDDNYKVFVHVFDPATERIVAQWDALPRNNSHPTSEWIAGEIVTDTITIPLADVPAGRYRIGAGLYNSSGRLPLSGTVGIDTANRRVILQEEIIK